jgi:flagellar basal-body rod protein FlgB
MDATNFLNQTTLPVLEQVVQFAQRRHAVLAGNVANLDTPGYRVRDLSPERFQARLKEALAQRDSSSYSQAIGTASHGGRRAIANVGTQLEGMLFHDDSNDGLEQQVAAISKNQSLHNLALTIMGSQVRLLRAAVSEQA